MKRWQVVLGFSEDYVIEAASAEQAVSIAYDEHPDAEEVIEITELTEAGDRGEGERT